MGIYLGLKLDVENTTEKEWLSVFDKANSFIEKSPLLQLTQMTVLEEDIFIYDKSKIRDNKYIKMDTDSNSYLSGESFILYKDFDVYKNKEKLDDNKVIIWNRKTQDAPYHKYILALSLVIEYYLPDKIEVIGDINEEDLEESKLIVKDLCDLDIKETSATNSVEEHSLGFDFFMSLFGMSEKEIDYDVFKDEYDLIKRLELISQYDLNKKGIDIKEFEINEIKKEIFRLSKKGSYIWNMGTVNEIIETNDLDLLRKYYTLLSLDLKSGDVFNQCDIKFFPDSSVIDLRKPKKLISKFVTYYKNEG